MELLQSGVDRSVIALWLGHESVETTQLYLHASMSMREKALSPRISHPSGRNAGSFGFSPVGLGKSHPCDTFFTPL
jgi:hypothetical protein